ncbi:hypothetical protein EDC91_1583 [Shewanella fodinae]|uniref:YcgL domain-containing protein n=1 Tax=Shewanella fodinae TaxID=552357 RepID=A0A4R2F0F4_9GAMM|nr:hypothetical protein EDC91_1583 [Shewanella fodinae]
MLVTIYTLNQPDAYLILKSTTNPDQFVSLASVKCRYLKSVDIEPTSPTIGFNPTSVINQLNLKGYALIHVKIHVTERECII